MRAAYTPLLQYSNNWKKDLEVTNSPRLTGEPIMRIFCKKTNTLVGYLYKWNNGDLQPAWLRTGTDEVRYVPMVETAMSA